jgi:hypothetical protein
VSGHRQLLVGRWLIIKLRENQNFVVVSVDRWQWRFENAAVGIWPRRGVSSWKQPLCQGAASLISDLNKPAAMADAINGRSLL